MRRHGIAGFCLVIALTTSVAVAAGSAQAKGLVLTTAGQGTLTQTAMTWSSASAGFTFGDEEAICPKNPLEKLKWKVTVDQDGSRYLGQVVEESAIACALPSGAQVTIEPDPHPWSVKLTGAGEAPIRGIGGKVQLLADFSSGGRQCTFQTGKLSLLFEVAGPLRPIPLEPGDPQPIGYSLVRSLSGAGCPTSATETLSFDASAPGPNGEETVLDE